MVNSGKLQLLFPTDFSEPAYQALHYVSHMAMHMEAEIALFHAVGLPFVATAHELETAAAMDLERIEAEQLNQLKQKFMGIFPALHYDSFLSNGYPIQEIAAFASQSKADLIVMGTRGANGLKELLVGSNTASLINHTETPVLAIPENARYNGFKKVVYATNLLNDDIRSLKQLLLLLKSFEPEITLLHVEDGHKANAGELMKAWFENDVRREISYPNLRYDVIKDSDIVKSLDQYLKAQASDLLVTATKKRNFFDRIFDRSITRKLAFHTDVPLLALHAQGGKSEPLF